VNNIFSKLKDFVGLNEPVEYYYEDDDQDVDRYQNLYQEENPPQAQPQPQPQPQTQQMIEEPPRQNRRWRDRVGTGSDVGAGTAPMNNVIGMPGVTNGISEVLVLEPRTFEEMPQAIQALRERKSVVLNLSIMDPDQAQRAVDFVAGGTYAIDGHQERIGESIFLFTPSCVQVSTQAGVVHEVPQTTRPQRPAAPAPAWANEPNRMVQ